MKKYYIALLLFSIVFFLPQPVWATDCSTSVPISGNISITPSCAFAGTINGVDTGTGTAPNTAELSVAGSATLTISAGQTIAVGSLSLPAGGGSIVIISGGEIKLGTPLWMIDADDDQWPDTTTQYAQDTAPVNGKRRNTIISLTQVDANDAASCTTNGANGGICRTCLNGGPTYATVNTDPNADCGAIDCHTGGTKYYNGWVSNTCYYKADISAANAVCDGAGACKTAATQCAASSQGVSTGVTRTSCKTQVGCTGTTIGSLGNVASGSDTSSDCTSSYNACSGNNRIGPDGNCNGAGACNTGGLSSACSTAGTCQTGGGCSAGSCVAVSNVASGQDPNNQCTASYNACSGNNRIGPDGNCNGAAACNTGGLSSACSTAGTCQTGGGCSAGSCVGVGNASYGTSCGTHYICNGAASCIQSPTYVACIGSSNYNGQTCRSTCASYGPSCVSMASTPSDGCVLNNTGSCDYIAECSNGTLSAWCGGYYACRCNAWQY